MANSFYYSNTAQATTLSGSVSSGATSIQVAATTGFPGSFPYILAVDYGAGTEELVSVTNAAGTTLTVTRGYGGTSAQSHSLGAVVRHVYNAQDATDFRTHEAATGAIHGVTGTLVGTSDTQTLANKTLTSPTINAGALSGTFTGSPTLSGAPTFSGTALFTGSPTFQGATTAAMALQAKVSGDSVGRLQVGADGQLYWGSGAAGADTVLFRAAADTMGTNDALRTTRSVSDGDVLQTAVTGDAGFRYLLEASGAMGWGDGTSVNTDTNLYRAAANELKTDDALTVVGDLKANNIYTGPWDTWTPTWSTTTGLHLPSFGNATKDCRFAKVGRTTFFYMDISFGSTTNFGASVTTADNWIFTLPVSAAQVGVPIGYANYLTGNTTKASAGMAQTFNSTNLQLYISGPQANGTGVAGGIVDSLTPSTWASGDRLTIIGLFEATT